MRRLLEILEIIWNGHSGRTMPVVLEWTSGQVDPRLQKVGADGWLEIAEDASLVFTPKFPRAPDEGLGIRQVPGLSSVIAADDVAALNMDFGRIALRPDGTLIHPGCIFEVTLTGGDDTARFAAGQDDGWGWGFLFGSLSRSADVSYFARQLCRKRAELGLPEIEVTTTLAGDYFRR